MTFQEICEELKKIPTNKSYKYITGNKTFTIEWSDDDKKIILNVNHRKNGVSLSLAKLEGFFKLLEPYKPINFDGQTKGGGNDRSAAEALFALTPHIFFKYIDKKKHIVFLPNNKHKLGYLEEAPQKVNHSNLPIQRIIFGAPGTGKSNKLNLDANYFRHQDQFDVKSALKDDYSKIDKNDEILQCVTLGNKYAKEIFEEKLTENDIDKLLKTQRTGGKSPGYYIILGAQVKKLNSNNWSSFSDSKFIERVTFHPNYSYAQFVGTYKPVTKNIRLPLSSDKRYILEVLTDKSKTGQEKYDLLFERFKTDNSLTRLPLLISLYSDDVFQTKKTDGTPASDDNSVERNHGRAIRPFVSLYDNNFQNETITYKYVAGPFMRTYVAAKNNPQQDYLLLIEEINRANVSAVFGDTFQLLDRKKGESEYPIGTSEDVKKFLKDEYNIDDCDELKLPSNMYIWATMNSADQGVFPMDTAFKRRWEFKYIDVDHDEERIQEFLIPVNKTIDAKNQTEIKFVRWNALRKRINAKLTYLGINEDKLMGPFFISLSKLEELKKMLDDIESLVVKKEDYIEDAEDEKNLFENNPKVFFVSSKSISEEQKNAIESFRSAFCGKVLMYLFEDAAKMRKTKLFRTEKIGPMRFSNICNKFAVDGLDIFDFSKCPL
jgi:hypothetical protein